MLLLSQDPYAAFETRVINTLEDAITDVQLSIRDAQAAGASKQRLAMLHNQLVELPI